MPWGHEPGFDIAGYTVSVVGEGHRSTAHDEHISDHTPASQTVTERGKTPLQFGPALKDTCYRRSCGFEVRCG